MTEAMQGWVELMKTEEGRIAREAYFDRLRMETAQQDIANMRDGHLKVNAYQVLGYASALLLQARDPMPVLDLLAGWSIHIPRPTLAELLCLFKLPRPPEAGRFIEISAGIWTYRLPADVVPPIPPGLRFEILKRDDYRCRLCGVSAKDSPDIRLEVDHITARSQGGTNDPSNLWVLCFSCNRGKGKKDL